MLKRNFSDLPLKESLQIIAATQLTLWNPKASSRPPSKILDAGLQRLRVFDLQTTDAGKALLIDNLLAEIVPNHPPLKVWKSALLDTETLTGSVDYLITPDYAYIGTPLLCIAQAKHDDFLQARAECVAEMIASQQNNRLEGYAMDVFGIVSSGQDWQFYRLTAEGRLFETAPFALRNLPELLGVLDQVCTECAQNVPTQPALTRTT